MDDADVAAAAVGVTSAALSHLLGETLVADGVDLDNTTSEVVLNPDDLVGLDVDLLEDDDDVDARGAGCRDDDDDEEDSFESSADGEGTPPAPKLNLSGSSCDGKFVFMANSFLYNYLTEHVV